MTYVPPAAVTSPRDRLELLGVILDEGTSELAIAHGLWEGNHVMLIRWNGSQRNGDGLGHPQSTGHSVWFVLPSFLAASTIGRLLERATDGDPKVDRAALTAAIAARVGNGPGAS